MFIDVKHIMSNDGILAITYHLQYVYSARYSVRIEELVKNYGSKIRSVEVLTMEL